MNRLLTCERVTVSKYCPSKNATSSTLSFGVESISGGHALLKLVRAGSKRP